MLTLTKFPAYASGNADCITKRTQLDPGDKVIVTDVNAEDLPVGTLCIHSSTVRMLVNQLNWQLLTPEIEAEIMAQAEQLERCLERLRSFEDLLSAIETAVMTREGAMA